MKEVFDKYGYVVDLDVAKQLIKAYYGKYLLSSDPWLKEVDEKLIEYNGGYTILRQNEFTGEDYVSLEGPICTSVPSVVELILFEEWIKDYEDSININDYCEGLVLYKYKDKWATIVIKEQD